MPRPVTLTDRATIEVVLGRPDLVPHGTTDPSAGSTIALRRRMARFSGPDHHPDRRAIVDALIARLDGATAERIAATVTQDLLAAGATEAAVVRAAPSRALLSLLGVRLDVGAAVDDIEAIVRVIGRGEPADEASDAATDRLLAAVPAQYDAVAVVSLLYQNFDATAALLGNTLTARVTGSAPEPAVRATRRVATAPSAIGDTELAAGEKVVLEIGAAGLPYGAGPHACPGRELAEGFVRGVVAALDASRGGPSRSDRNV